MVGNSNTRPHLSPSESSVVGMSAGSIAALVRHREVKVTEVVEQTLAHVEAVDGELNAFCEVFDEQATERHLRRSGPRIITPGPSFVRMPLARKRLN